MGGQNSLSQNAIVETLIRFQSGCLVSTLPFVRQTELFASLQHTDLYRFFLSVKNLFPQIGNGWSVKGFTDGGVNVLSLPEANKLAHKV